MAHIGICIHSSCSYTVFCSLAMGLYSQISMQLNAFAVPLPPGERAPFQEPPEVEP